MSECPKCGKEMIIFLCKGETLPERYICDICNTETVIDRAILKGDFQSEEETK